MSRTRRTAAILTAVAMAGSALVAGTAPASAAVPVYDASLAPFTSAQNPSSVVLAAGRLFVTDGNVVRVLTTGGSPVATLSGITGAADATTSPDGGTVYVVATGSDEIVAIDPTGPSISTRYAVGTCPRELAVSATDVWYTYGCQAGTGGINHITRSTGAVHAIDSPDAGFAYSAAHLGYGGGRLFAYDGNATGWPATDGSLGAPVVNETDGAADTDFVVSDSRVVLFSTTDSSYGYTVLGLDLVKQRSVSTASTPLAAAFTASGDRLVTGIADEIAFGTVDPATGELLQRSRMPLATEQVPIIEYGGLVVSADGKLAYAIAHETTDPLRYYVVTAAVTAPPPTPVTVSVTGLTYLGATGTITVRTAANRQVTLKLTDRLGTISGTFTSNADGVVRVSARTSYSGTVTASVRGDATHAAGSRTTVYHVPASIVTAMSKGYKKRKGVTYYKKFSQVQVYAGVAPGIGGRPVYATLFVKKGSHWRRVSVFTLHTNDRGVVGARLFGNRKRVVMMVMFNFRGDRDNGGATEYTGRFAVG